MISSSTIILFTAVAIIGLLTLPTNILNTFSQGLEIPELKSKIREKLNSNGENTAKTPSEEIAMKILLEEHENEYLDDYYQVDDFAFVASNNSKLCPSGNCEYELEGGEMAAQYSPGERDLTGKFKVDTGESKKIMNMRASWETVEERETADGEIVQVVEGTFGVGRNEFNPENEYQINGTLTPDGDGYILEAKGFK